jgi:RimJ/RimL family protein N-acetyltransferase
MKSYKILQKQIFESGIYKIVPIRYDDKALIMNWRNEQIYHLRQNHLLTIEEQDSYFLNTVNKLFDKRNPDQILFSFLENDICIGYGGLVHINWFDKNAEISFIINTSLEEKWFQKHWSTYLQLIEKVAFDELTFHKIFAYAFDVRPHLYETLEGNNFFKDAVLKEHRLFNGSFIDVIIYSKLSSVG